MAYTASEFISLDHAKVDPKGDQRARCGSCNCALRENITGYRFGQLGARCSDCYFAELSDVVETHPVGLPSVRR